jgi:hypothetical protein
MIQQFYRVVIENDRYKYVKMLRLFILFINVAALALVSYMEKDAFSFVWPLLILLSMFLIWSEKKLKKYKVFKLTNFTATGFIWAITGWLFTFHWWIALVVTIVAVLQFLVKNKYEVRFYPHEIYIQSFHKKIFHWLELQNVVLKDGMLTIDFKNNRIFQSEILAEESNVRNETEFNEFCRLQLTIIYN